MKLTLFITVCLLNRSGSHWEMYSVRTYKKKIGSKIYVFIYHYAKNWRKKLETEKKAEQIFWYWLCKSGIQSHSFLGRIFLTTPYLKNRLQYLCEHSFMKCITLSILIKPYYYRILNNLLYLTNKSFQLRKD